VKVSHEIYTVFNALEVKSLVSQEDDVLKDTSF